MEAPGKDIDMELLAGLLDALASPVRLRLLEQLRQPRALSGLRVQPSRAEGGVKPQRPMTTANVRNHVHQLVEAGVVGRVPVQRSGHPVDYYQVSRPHLFALTEELHHLALQGGGELLDGTMPAPPMALGARAPGPHLVLVRGVDEGKVYPLSLHEGRGWSIGRRHGADVCLDYDGYVSLDNSSIACEGGTLCLRDSGRSRNGTTVNWAPVAAGESHRLKAGDVIGVGRSRLLFRED